LTPAEFFRGLRDGDTHRGGIRCLRLFSLEPAYFGRAVIEVMQLVRDETASIAGDPGHVTNWTRPQGLVRQFSLLNRSGRFDDFSSDHDLSCLGKSFHARARYPALASLVEGFPHAVNFRINAMAPGARLPPHEEQLLVRTRTGVIGMRVRCHLPIVTNEAAELMMDGEVYHLDPGTIYLVNHGCVHSAWNGGAEERFHLVWDTLLTRAAFDLLMATTTPNFPAWQMGEAERIPEPLRCERIGPWVAVPARVSPAEIERLGWCEIQ
jgi:hypothetical protein